MFYTNTLNSLFDDFFSVPTRQSSSTRYNDGVVQIALPGFSKEDLNIEIEGRNLIISAHISSDEETSFRQSFTKVYTLGNNVDPDVIDAKMENGVLTLDLSCAVKTKQIAIS
jgi:HSP20 family molecular chaperone IbpA